jgi:uncharacterized iron-regulated membrane protein
MNKLLSFIFLMLLTCVSHAQEAQMADTFRSEGKIYVVIAVLAIVFISVLGILLYIERKISKLEKEIKEQKS